CFTNTFPEITCTNQFLTPTSVNLRETLTAALGVNRGCDELDGLFPSNAVLQINLSSNLRSNDWRGAHAGIFKILDGTNIIAYGAVSGANGVGSHRGLEACALCNHIEGTLRGTVFLTGPLRGAGIQAAYSGNIGVTCPSSDVPQGAVSLNIDGTVVTRCPSLL